MKLNKIKYRYELINYLIEKNNYKSYLEIGVRKGSTFNNINCNKKVGVDPNPININIDYEMESDSFFEKNKNTFDIIFIDGLHYSKQVYKDILNSLKFLNDNGVIVCHDMNPKGYVEQLYPMKPGTYYWNGDCWKSWLWLRRKRKDLNMFVVDIDNGCGIIKRGNQEIINFKNDLSYKEFEKNKKEILNLLTLQEIKNKELL